MIDVMIDGARNKPTSAASELFSEPGSDIICSDEKLCGIPDEAQLEAMWDASKSIRKLRNSLTGASMSFVNCDLQFKLNGSVYCSDYNQSTL